MTEEEAKAKWCPFVRYQDNYEGHAAINRGGTGADRCIASACMAWREQVIPEEQENRFNVKERPEGDDWKPWTPKPDNHSWWRVRPEQRIGYCGLAGAPR